MMFLFTRILRYAVGTKENGNRRIYIQNFEFLNDVSFFPNSRFDITVTAKEIILKLNEVGQRKVILSKRGDSIIELSDKLITNFIGSCAKFVTVKLSNNEIRISHHHMEVQRTIREFNFTKAIKRKELTTASLYSGTGALSYTMGEGLKDAGFEPRIKFANEIDEIAAKLNTSYNPIWDNAAPDACFVMDDIQSMDMSVMPKYVDHLEISLPCPPYSALTSKDRRDIAHPLGKLFMRTTEAIARLNPATLTIECTTHLLNSNAFLCISDFLSLHGYSFETTVLKGTEFGDFEQRKRFCLFAVSSGLKGLFPSLNKIDLLHHINPQTFADIKDDIPEDSPLWKEFGHVKKRDSMPHLNYRNVLIGDKDKSMPALLASSSPKAGAPFVCHPSNPNLQRQITVEEHTKIRKFPERLAQATNKLGKGLLPGQVRTNKTAAHKLLGNSVCPGPWRTLMFYMFSGLHTNNAKQIGLF
ncbi:MAG: DNA (cytosine-5)-methyltransferase 1 [Colwellia sp.]|jgi:DNA (cytosine-5)-methyltransferase 1